MWEKTYYLARFLLKPAWKWKHLDQEGERGSLAPPDPPMNAVKTRNPDAGTTWYIDAQSLIQLLAYSEIDDANFKGALWTFKQWLALEMRMHYGISIVILLISS